MTSLPKAPKRPGRTKPRRAEKATVEEKRHMDRIATLGCLVCKMPATIHHERKNNSRRDHKRTVPLCPVHHLIQFGELSREALGRDGFEEVHKIDLWKRAGELWEESEML